MSNTNQQKPVYRFGEFTLDMMRGALQRNGEEICLRPQSIVVMQVLLEAHGQLVSKDELHDRVWGRKAVTDDSIAQCIADIRRALGDTDRKLVRTVPRRGYLFDGNVSIKHTASDVAKVASSPWIRRVAVLAGMLLAAMSGWSYWLAHNQPPSIAVLPLINMSAVAENSFFGEGLHEEILTNLSHVENLRVISRTTMSRYLNSSQSVRDIARELDVQYIVEGSVRRVDNHVRVTVQLLDALADSHLWARSYDRKLLDIFGTQSEVAREITNSLQLEIVPHSVGTLDKMPTRSVKAYDLFTKANSIHRGEAISEDAYRRQRDLLEAAVAEDPDFVEAWARLNDHLDEIARTIVQDEWFGETKAERDAYFAQTRQAAKRALDRAVALEPDNVATQLALGCDAIAELENYEFRIKRKKYLDRALELDPTNAWTWYSLGWYGWDAGNLEKGTEAILKALELDPLHAHIVGGSLSYFSAIGDREMAALLADRYALIAPKQSQSELLADLPSHVRLKRLYNLFLYTAEETMIETLAETYAAEVENFVGRQDLPGHLDFWRALVLILQKDFDALLQLEPPESLDEPTFEQAMYDIRLFNIVLAAQRHTGQLDGAMATARRILGVRAQLDIDPATAEGFQAAVAITQAILTVGDEEQMRSMREFLLDDGRGVVNTWNPWAVVALSHFDLESAVELLLQKKAERRFWHGTDVIAANHVMARDLLAHPEMQAFYAAEGKWINYLATREPAYARWPRQAESSRVR